MSQMNLDAREKLGLACGLFALFLVLLLGGYIAFAGGKGTLDRYDRSRKALSAKKTELEVARMDLRNEEIRIASQSELKQRLESRNRSFDLFAFMNSTLSESGLQPRARLENYVPAVRSRGNSENKPAVRLTLDPVSLDELVKFLHKVYAAENLIVMERFEVAPTPKNQGLHCEVTFLTVKA